ncbi:protein-export membrane protein SecF [candidate division WWE3 bacterium RIFOXYC1_FULL_39_7]|uniref:Protein-export membrane protein SecF n=2 Tax=Katanobacteria TaxID=422282 RepID=A0A1F4X720_UNCKA|nr:MAG: protein-export membrane protein SecF [candidate division WWE3 bacterium RIFOXYC1_FULL_39_7]OGC77452.1 MAG: protein-export membrane protein SecF [candidate division WWE3 bacterium RIFOXYD1_FULL_39_9]
MEIIKYKYHFLIFSLVLLIPGIIFLAVFGLRLSIDFVGGSLATYEVSENSTQIVEESIKKTYSENSVELENFSIEGSNKLVVRTKPVDVNKNQELKTLLEEKHKDQSLKQVAFETVGPVVGRETTQNAFVSLAWASLGILLYIAYAFRNVPKPFSSVRFGAAAIIAMLHDAVLVLGVFSILGYFYGTEVDSLFITAILTVIGFSVHDTIVVFDRIRENLSKLPSSFNFESVVNFSIVETLNRSLATSFTVVLTLSSLYLLGGESIKTFVFAMLIGIISGTYSSIFTASPILVIWEDYVRKRSRNK